MSDDVINQTVKKALYHGENAITYVNAATAEWQHAADVLIGMDTAPKVVIPLGQRDPLWAGKVLGFSTHGQTIGGYGCTITALAMWLNFVTPKGAYAPDSVNDALKAAPAGYVWDAQHTDRNLVNWMALPAIYPQLVFNGKVDCPNTPAPLNLIDTQLDQGLPVIVYVDAQPLAGLQQHFVLITKKRTNDYDIANPWSGTMQTLSVYRQGTQNMTQIICGIVKLAVAI